MEPASTSGSDAVEQVVHTSSGSVCDSLQPQTPEVCQPVSGRRRDGRGRSFNKLGRTEGVRLSPLRDFKQSRSEVRTVGELRADPDRPLLAESGVVPDHNQPQHRASISAATTVGLAETTYPEHFSRESSGVKFTRMEIIQKKLNACGLPKTASDIMLKGTRSSTLLLYDRRWASFEKWCIANKVKPLDSSVPEILSYLEFLRTELNLTPGTIAGHKTAILVTLSSSTDRILNNDVHIKQYIKGLMTTAAPKSTIPDWDLSLVLKGLTRAPFEPLGSCDSKYLTFKTVFLLAFATAARRSELHAFSKDFVRDEHWTYVRLKTVEGFVSKNQNTLGFRSYVVKSLAQFTSTAGLEDERLMCPVRALRIYTNRTLRTTENDHLFVSFKKGHSGAIHPNTLSSWLKQTIRLCYELAGKPLPTRIVAHSVRSMAVSWANLKNVGLNQILEACFWKAPNTFISFYLKDLTEFEGEMRKLGKVSTVSNVV